jgi:hypothetical protein
MGARTYLGPRATGRGCRDVMVDRSSRGVSDRSVFVRTAMVGATEAVGAGRKVPHR